MRFNDFVFKCSRRAPLDPAEFVSTVQRIIDTAVDAAMDGVYEALDGIPWTAEEMTRHVESFVNRWAPPSERAESTWSDTDQEAGT
jgi:hypothetical protein